MRFVNQWADTQTNAPLRDMQAVQFAKDTLASMRVPLHPDRWKNWDNYLAMHHVTDYVAPDDGYVLDAGACRSTNHSPSVFLPGLAMLGYEHLYGCNLDEPEGEPVEEDGAVYEHQNIECTTYSSGFFDFIACLSVVEHGVNIRKYFSEMSRILKPGGWLFTSFDYWPEPIDTRGVEAFGAPVKIFTRRDVEEMIMYAAQVGLRAETTPKFDVGSPVVNWMGFDYTFYNLLLCKD